MKYIANILTDKALKFNALYNVVNDRTKIIENIPTLIIGWEFTKKIFPNANILEWEIEKNIYWTYGNREKRNKYEENLEKFKALALKQFIKSVKYEYCNILIVEKEEKVRIFNIINKIGAHIYANGDMLYVYDDVENKVIGLSLRDIDYIGGDRKKIFASIYKNEKNNFITLNNEELSMDIRSALRNYNYVIPFLLR